MKRNSGHSTQSRRSRQEDASPLDWDLSDSSHSLALSMVSSADRALVSQGRRGIHSSGAGSIVSFGERSLAASTTGRTNLTDPQLEGDSERARISGETRPSLGHHGSHRSLPSSSPSSRSLVSYEGSRKLVSLSSVGDDNSLAGQSLAYSNYSLDDQSRTSTYISEASVEEEVERTHFPQQSNPAHSPSLSRVERPVEYIMQEEYHDDDVSTIGGTFFNDASSVWDASTIATTPTLRQEIGPALHEQDTIYEEEESEEEEESDENEERSAESSKRSKVSQQSSHPPDRGMARGAQGHSMSTVGMDSAREQARSHRQGRRPSTGQVSEASASQTQGTFNASMYDRQSADDAISLAGSIRSADFSGTGVTDEDAFRYHEEDEDYDDYYDADSYADQSLPVLYPDDSASLVGARSVGGGSYGRPPRAPKTFPSSASVSWSRSGSEQAAMSLRGARTVQSEVLYRGGMSGVGSVGSGSGSGTRSIGARTVQSDGYVLQQRKQDFREIYQQQRPRAALPTTPEVLQFGADGPMMTKGMSGRAVVHVAMSSATDGSIQDLEYTTPLVEDNEIRSIGYGNGSTTLGSGRELPWFEYYVKQHGWVEKCYSRRCYRINALILLCTTLLISVIVTLTTVSTGNSPVPHEGRSAAGLLNDLTSPAALDIPIPSLFERHVHDWLSSDNFNALQPEDVPFFWNIPLSSANLVQENWGACLGLTQASGVGRIHASNETLKVIQIFGASYVNVDTTTSAGIDHAIKMDLMGSGLADVMFSPLVTEVLSNLYSRRAKAKLIIVLRHPIDRAVAMYRYLSTATSDPRYDPSIALMTLEQFSVSKYIDNNYVCRVLLNKFSGALSEDDLNQAKEILRRKAVVGIYDDMLRTVQHIERYFGWLPFNADAAHCQRNSIEAGLAKHAVPVVDPGSAAWELIKSHNRYDLALYEYARNVVFPYQHEVIRRQFQSVSTPVA